MDLSHRNAEQISSSADNETKVPRAVGTTTLTGAGKERPRTMTHDTPVTNDPEDIHEAPANPEDVAGLYSWAKGSKYRDFSASREITRANARDRSEAERSRLTEEPVAPALALREPDDIVLAGPIEAAPLVQPLSVPSLLVPPTLKVPEIPTTRPQSPGLERRKMSVATKWSPTPPPRGAPSRWAALNNVFEETPPKGPGTVDCGVPALALVSLAGGVGKTSLVASLGRSLAVHGENVLLVDTGMHSLLPLYFGSHDLTPGGVTTFPGGDDAAAVRVMTMDPGWTEGKRASEHRVAEKIAEQAHGMDRILIDVSTGSAAVTREVLRLSPTVLMTLTPDMASVVSLPAARAFFQQLADEIGQPLELFYILNQFDASLRFHGDVHDLLARQLGDRLLPFSIRRSSAVSEALAEGMTVVDYVPGSQIVEELEHLSHWVRELDLPARNEIHPIRRREQSC